MLHPPPIMGIFYRWSVDLTGPFPKSEYGNYYIMVLIEHFGKWVEGVAIPSKESGETRLCRYGAPAEVLTDQGSSLGANSRTCWMRRSSITVGRRGITLTQTA